MAEVVVEFVLKKLADVIVTEARVLGGVGKKVERVQRELTRIKCCLKDADSKCKGDERVQNWLNELRDVAYHIEDATDTFFLKVECRDARFLQKLKKLFNKPKEQYYRPELGNDFDDIQNILKVECRDPRFLQKLKKVCNKPKELYFRHKLGNELDDIQNLLKEIYESRVTYGIRDMPLEDKSKGEAVKMPFRRATYSEVDENEVVGMQADKNNIMELLRPQKTSRRAVITIVGAGGLGKTTLACVVYRSAKEDFDYHLMLSISQQFSVTDLLRKMICKYNDSVPKDRDEDYYVGELKSFLSSKRYLIILDDVWTGDLWNELKDVLPDVKNGSRVLMTSRSIEVAKSADSKMAPYELKFLDDEKSLDLLLKKALPYQEPDEEFPSDLKEIAVKLSKKCKGLPLALVVLGGILLTKELSYPAWERVLQIMNWPSDGSACMQILGMSYEDMPYYLKACFQYLASFPEDYEISAKSLIRMWVAEGFIPLDGRPTIEMAEECLEELAKRSMVQVLSRSTNGLIKNFKVHDILRELAMDKAGHENFVTVFSHASNDTKPNRIIRRASLQAEEKNSQFMKYVGSNTRSLLLFEPKNSEMSLLQCSNFRLLKVLVIVGKFRGIRGMEYDLKSLDELIHLKYLELSGLEIDLSSFSFHRMKRLETLDLRWSNQCVECGDFWTIGTLMHVLVDYGYLNPPISIATLSNLRTLKWVTVKGAFDWKLPNLRKLGLRNKSEEWVSITNLLQTLPFLVSLRICTDSDLPMEIVYPKALPNYHNLQSLYLYGKWSENVNVEASLFPPHLVKLSLCYSKLNHNPMPELGKLNSLKKLLLEDDMLAQSWEDPIICPEGFPALQYLTVTDTSIKDLTVAQGVMPKLTYLQVRSNCEVHLPPELQHVTVERWG